MSDGLTIEECKAANILPQKGTPVKTICKDYDDIEGWFVAESAIKCRKNADGVYLGWASGAGGDVWYIEHDEGIGAYLYTEVFDR